MAAEQARIAIIGAGSIGLSFAIAFARSQVDVTVYDLNEAAIEQAPHLLKAKLDVVTEVTGDTQSPSRMGKVRYTTDLASAVQDADLVIECAPEKQALKQALFAELERLTPSTTILASASSALPISVIAGELASRERCILAHPANPPHIIPMIELVPASFTADEILAQTDALFRAIGMQPIHVRREIEGFVMNRLQGALLREAYCLVRDGIASVEDVDTVVRTALGPRWAVAGPFETADLNTQGGIEAHAAKLGPAYERMGAQRGQHDPWTPELVAEVTRQRRSLLPLEQWGERVLWREREVLRRLQSAKNE